MNIEKKDIIKLFFALFLFSLSGGIFYNFQQLWIVENGMSVKTVGTVLSLGALITVSFIFVFSNIITKKRLQRFTSYLLVVKAIIILMLYFLYGSGNNILIKFLIIMDFAIDTEIYTCMYPLITFITKNDKIYALRGLVYEISYYFGVLFTSFALGKVIVGKNIIYNSYLFIAVVLIIGSYFVLNNIHLDSYIKSDDKNNNILINVLKKIKNDKISKNYLLFSFFEQVSYYIILSLFLSFLTEKMMFSPTLSSNIILIVSVISIILGIFILYKGTLKNNYINLSIKYLGRFLFCLVAVLFANNIVILIAIIFERLLYSSYTHISDAPYINRFDGSSQLSFCNLCEMINYLGVACGTYLCGLFFAYSYRVNIILSVVFAIIELYFMYKSLYLLNKEKLKDDR